MGLGNADLSPCSGSGRGPVPLTHSRQLVRPGVIDRVGTAMIRLMVFSLMYALARFLLEILLVRHQSEARLRAEVLALRHQLRSWSDGLVGRAGGPPIACCWPP